MRILSPFNQEPPPRYAENSKSCRGTWTTAALTLPFLTTAKECDQLLPPLIKSLVPSMGSITKDQALS